MAVDSIVLEQLLASGGEEDVYTVPTGRRASVRVHVSVKTAATISIKLRKNGAATDASQFVSEVYSASANTPIRFPEAGTFLLSAGDIVTVESSQTDTAFTVNGYEDDIPTE